MKTKDPFYLHLEKIFIKYKMYRQPWFEHAASQEELMELTKAHLEQSLSYTEKEREITVDDVKRLLKTSMTYITNCNKTSKLMKNYQLPPASLFKSYQPDYVFLPKANFVSAHSVYASDKFQNEQSMDLPIAAGRSFDGKLILFDLAKSPHLFIGGVDFQLHTQMCFGLESIVTSLLFKKKPSEVQFVTIGHLWSNNDIFRKIAKQFFIPIPKNIYTTKDAFARKMVDDLNWVKKEMNRRFEKRTNDECSTFPYLVIIASDVVEYFSKQPSKKMQQEFQSVTLQLLEKAHEVGIHLVFHQWYFTNDLITKSIVEKFSSRIAFHMDETRSTLMFAGSKEPMGFDLGNGEMLYYRNGSSVKGASPRIEKCELEEIFKHIKSQC